MLQEFRKSVNNIFYERMVSPLFGSFIFSWAIWNWKIIYLTLFVKEEKLSINKIDYIANNYFDVWNLIWFPVISTLSLIIIYPFLSIGAYYLSIKFKSWKKNIRNIEEKKQTLTIEDSIELRREVRNQEIKFDNLLKSKNEEITSLKLIIENYQEELTKSNNKTSSAPVKTIEDDYSKEFQQLKGNEILYEQFSIIAPRAQGEYTMFTDDSREKINRKMFDYFLANDIIIKEKANLYKFTKKGKILNSLN